MEERVQRLWDYLEGELFPLPSERGTKPLFNPYSSIEKGFDRPGGERIRQENLHNYFSSFVRAPRVLVLGEAPGWRGCRFSGVPFTSEAQLTSGELPFSGEASNGWGEALNEASATIFWKSMRPFFPHFFTWNCLALHPHQFSLPASNRVAATGEITRFDHLLKSVASILEPRAVLAVGKAAQMSLDRNAIKHSAVRHPAHGGAAAFHAGVEEFFRLIGIDPS